MRRSFSNTNKYNTKAISADTARILLAGFLFICIGFFSLSANSMSDAPEKNEGYKENIKEIVENSEAQQGTKVGCIIAGCNREKCVEENNTASPSMSPCVFKEEHSCYVTLGLCEADENGKCGWKLTEDLKSCLEQF